MANSMIIIMENNEVLFNLFKAEAALFADPVQLSYYTIFFIEQGKGIYHTDFSKFSFAGPVLLFSTPLQQIYIEEISPLNITVIQFHGDFYCIEYHRAEVSCNGLLFNNCYIEPSINLTDKDLAAFQNIIGAMEQEFKVSEPNGTVIRSYLQLLLAKSSAIKINALDKREIKEIDVLMEQFHELIDQNYLTLRKPREYAKILNMSPNNLTKRCTKYFNKTPSQLISERLILEAKKQLHLTNQSVKEIAYRLKFQDEFYFSRVFKKFTNVSPQAFRDKTGISVVASLPDYQLNYI
jgi:AraC family transcriptional activator of pobA